MDFVFVEEVQLQQVWASLPEPSQVPGASFAPVNGVRVSVARGQEHAQGSSPLWDMEGDGLVAS